MKPRLFIVSSVEGLEIANAAQVNLQHEAEVSVWSQGIFQLSQSSLDSLLSAVKTFDFALFIFSPDDIVTIRGEENSAVRDNVVFELGIFVNQLGNQRVFILIPDGPTELRIPTDLIGVTPGTYEKDRSDGNYTLATEPVCYQIVQQIQKLGSLNPGGEALGAVGIMENNDVDAEAVTGVPETSATNAASEDDEPKWIDAYIDRRLDDAIVLLEKRLNEIPDLGEKRRLECWIGRVKYRMDWATGTSYLESMIEKYPGDEDAYIHLAYAHMFRDQFKPALDVIEKGLAQLTNPMSMFRAKSACYNHFGMADLALTTMRNTLLDFPGSSELYAELAGHYEKNSQYDEARSVLENGIQMIPENERLLSMYATLLLEHFEPGEALGPYSDLVQLFPDSPEYRAYRGNVFLKLDINDLAMQDYRRANEAADSSQAWILANIGNLLKNRGLYAEGIEFLNRAIEIEPGHSYSHQRLAITQDLQTEEKKKAEEFLKETRISLSVRMLPNSELS